MNDVSSKPTPRPTAQYFHEPADRGRLCVVRRNAARDALKAAIAKVEQSK